ncbi:unnamed protein product, partial [Polarella glacialis]
MTALVRVVRGKTVKQKARDRVATSAFMTAKENLTLMRESKESQSKCYCYEQGHGNKEIHEYQIHGRERSPKEFSLKWAFESLNRKDKGDDSDTGSSEDRRVTRSLCAVFGDRPLDKIPGVGWYFRLTINSVTPNW